MRVFDDPKEDLDWIEDELWEEEEEEVRPRRRLFGRRKARRAETMAEREAVYVDGKSRPRVKGIRRLKFLALLETLAILAVLWGWIKWLY